MWLPILLIVLGVLIVYSNTWRSPFVLDDIHTIVEEDARRTLYFTVERLFGNRSLPIFSFDLNYYFNGLNVSGYRAVNIGIHIISSIGVFWLAYWLSVRVYKTRIITLGQVQVSNHLFLAELAGLFFAVHPIQTQAVTYIVQRLASMAAMFYILALWAYVKYRLSLDARSQKIWAGLSLAATIAAMHSKETAITLPIIILLLEILVFTLSGKKQKWWRVNMDWRSLVRRIPLVTPWLLTILIIPAYSLEVRDLLWHIESEPSSMAGDTFLDKVNIRKISSVSAETTQIPRQTYFLTQINVVRTYLRLVAWPSGQNIDHDYPLTVRIRDKATIASFVLHVVMMLTALIFWKRRRRIAALGILFFYIALLPESSFIPIVDVMFEHRLYLPMVGAALFVGDMGQLLLERVGFRVKQRAWAEVAVIGISTILIFSLAVAGYVRNRTWKDEISLWTDATQKSPNKARPHNNLAKAYLDRQMFDRAEEMYKRELEIDPNSVSGHNNLGSIYGVQGKYEEAIKEIQQALAKNPNHDAAYNNLGNVLMLQGKLVESEEAYDKSIALNTKDAGVYRNLGDVLAKQGKYEKAVGAYQQAVSMVPDQPLWHSKLGAALGALHRTKEAKAELEIAIKLNPQLANAYSNLGNVLADEGDYNEAAKAYATYLQITPNDTVVMNNLAKIFIRLENPQKAQQVWQAILKIDPDNTEAKNFISKMAGP
jgi:tetratricopeptide (TPR) repeat protein